MTEIKTMDFTLPSAIPEEFRRDYELNVLEFKTSEYLSFLGRNKFSELYQITLNGNISSDILKKLHQKKGQELSDHILGNEEFENFFRKRCSDKCKASFFHSKDDTDKILLSVLEIFDANKALKSSN